MKAALLVGGRGTRLQPVTDYIPKPLVPVAGKPCIEYLVESMARAGIGEIFVTTSYRPDLLIAALQGGDRFGVRFAYAIEEVPAGPAGAVKRIERFLGERFVVANGDLLLDIDFADLLSFHESHGGKVTIALHEVEDPSPFGVAALDDDSRIVRFQEKPKREDAFSNLINAGVYIVEPEVLSYVPEGEFYDWSKHLFPLLLEKGVPIYGRTLKGDWLDVGRPSDLIAANQRMARKYGTRHPQGHLVNRSDAADAHIHFSGDCYIGPGAVIAKGSRIESSSIGRRATVGSGAVVRDSVVLDGATVGEHASLERVIVCPGKVVDARTRLVDHVVG